MPLKVGQNMLALCLGAALCITLPGCDDDKPVTAVPTTGGSTAGGGSGGGLGGVDGGGTTGGGDPGGGGDADGCIDVAPGSIQNSLTITDGPETELGFEATKAYVQWTGSCSNAFLIIGITEGVCAPTFDETRQFVFRIDQEAIGTLVGTGGNFFNVENNDTIRASYRSAEGTWSNCDLCPGTYGDLIFSSLAEVKDGQIAGNFEFFLKTGSFDDLPLAGLGKLDLTLPQSFSEYCPEE